MGLELEYKFSATEAAFAALQADFEDFREIQMATTYFDTPDRAFSSRHCTFRLRQENGVGVCTLKLPRPDGHREEYECEAVTIEAGAARLPQVAKISGGPYVPVCSARFTRLAAAVAFSGAVLELALDRGVLSGGGREIPLQEVEVELKAGDPQLALAFARLLQKKYGLQPEEKSKFARAMALAEGAGQ